ncbi:hypothetical protein SLS62_006041 [Diatrype stigma]|uniref:Carboxylesterase type B domain-containing protein n=1 Tax=Diatrype stigma TaxID=117547 RepID=A0AAN9YSB4_9PEZI
MARGAVPWTLALGALLFALASIYLGSVLDIEIPFALASAPVVIDSGRDVQYIGSRLSGVEHFQNIFYAEDTTGRNRFAPPVPLRHPQGSVVDASRPGAWCSQGTGDVLPFTSRVTNVSGHALGSAYEVLYEPDGLVKQAAKDGQPLIFVAINYRLGLFGFATSKAMRDVKHTNAGLRDQRAAFEWVHDNIETFGGDPKRVTAIGQSVGANDVSFQLLAFGGTQDAPFQRAVLMSGGPGMNHNSDPAHLVEENTAAIAQQVGCVKGGNSQSADTLECLRQAPADILTNLSVTASRAAHPPFGEAFFYPTVDGDFFPDRPSKLLRAGKFAKGVPVIGSWVTNDGAWYPLPTVSSDEDVLASVALWLPGLSASTQARLLELYPLADFAGMVRPAYDGPISPQYYRAAQITRDFWFACPALGFAWHYARHGGAGPDPAQVRLYEHNATRYTPVFEAMGVPMWRVAHLSDIPYVLNTRRVGGGADNSAAQRRLAKVVSRSIAEFVTSAGPPVGGGSRGGIEAWPPAFENVTQAELLAEGLPSKVSLALFGGRDLSAPVTISQDRDSQTGASEASRAVGWERLFERCGFINSEKVVDEVGW